MSLSLDVKIRRWRVHRSGLAGAGFDSPERVAHALVGVQAQDNVAAVISIWNRLRAGSHACDQGQSAALTAADIVSNGSALIKIWGQRGTLHMYHVDDWPLVVGGVYDTLAAQCIDRVSDPDLVRSSVRDIADQLATTNGVVRVDRHDPVTSRSIRMLLTLGGHAAWPLTLTHARVNRIVEMRARHSWTSTPWESPALSDAARCLALRYFSTYGPALESDFRYMMGIRAEPSRRAVADLLADGTLSDIGNGLLLPTVLRRDWQRFRAGPVPLRMLYCFDPLVLAHARKTWLIEDAYRSLIWTRNAIVHGVVLVDGRIAGKWTLGRQRRRQQTEARIEVEIFSDAFAIDRAAACAQLNGIAVCLDLKSLSVEWR